jgi:hypothetical protein
MRREPGDQHGPSHVRDLYNEFANQAGILKDVEDDVLNDWFRRQVGWWGLHARKLEVNLKRNLAAVQNAPKTDRRWVTMWMLELRYEWAMGEPCVQLRPGHSEDFRYPRGAITALREAQHMLVCPNHGVQGVEPAEWVKIADDVKYPWPEPEKFKQDQLTPLYEAMAFRGMLLEARPETWQRYCERCMADVFSAQAESILDFWQKAKGE